MSKLIFFLASPYVQSEVSLALEGGVHGLVAEAAHLDEASRQARVTVWNLADTPCREISVRADEEAAGEALARGESVLLAPDWEVIPVENLITRRAGGAKLALAVDDLARARLAAEIMELGADVIVLTPKALPELPAIMAALSDGVGSLELTPATITGIEPVGLGHRVCVDTLSLFSKGEGVLCGDSSAFTFLTHAETEVNEFVASRPFRVNAGAVHAYIFLPGDRTAYLSEIKGGQEVLAVSFEGKTRSVVVGRSKQEVRPMLKISAEAEGGQGSIFLQNAETICLTRPDGGPVSVVDLKIGDKVLCRLDAAGRHFGRRIAENIAEV